MQGKPILGLGPLKRPTSHEQPLGEGCSDKRLGDSYLGRFAYRRCLNVTRAAVVAVATAVVVAVVVAVLVLVAIAIIIIVITIITAAITVLHQPKISLTFSRTC